MPGRPSGASKEKERGRQREINRRHAADGQRLGDRTLNQGDGLGQNQTLSLTKDVWEYREKTLTTRVNRMTESTIAIQVALTPLYRQ